MPLTPLCTAHMNSIREALLSLHSPSKLGYQVSGIRMDLVLSISLSPLFWWVLVTTELKGDLEVVGAKIVEVLHSTAH